MRKLTNATNRNPYPVYEIRSLSEMMSIIGRRRQYGFTTIFRGHCDDRYKLTPSIARIKIAPEEEVERRLYVRGTRWMIDFSNWTQSVAEATMFSEFCRQIPAYREHHPADQWELLAIAQHHKLPTRLLDWTYNPYVAAWFAVGKPPKDGVRFGVVWMHVPNEEDYLTEEEQKNSPFELTVRAVHIVRSSLFQGTSHRESEGKAVFSPCTNTTESVKASIRLKAEGITASA
jgi:FRG domain